MGARVLAIFGPTAVGKSALAHAAAKALDGEIVLADPFQRYRGLEVAADSPSARDRAEVTYHLVGDLALTEASSVGAYAPLAHAAVDAVLARGRVPIVTGGSGLYLRAALTDLDFPRDPPREVRDAAERAAATDLPDAVASLRRLAPDVAERVDAQNPRRVARALALAMADIALPEPSRLWTDETRHPTCLIGLSRPRPLIDTLIATRVARELADGLVRELETAIDSPGCSRAATQIIGAKEVLAMRDGTIDADELPDLLAARTRKLARAQLTWIRKTQGLVEIDLGDRPATDALPRLLDLWSSGG